jgi:HEAT repeat protein
MAKKKPQKAEIEGWLAALRDHEGLIRQRARDRLVELGRSVTPFLEPLLSDQHIQTRWEAAKALSEIADPASIPALIRTLGDDDNDVSWLAAEGLAAIGRPAVPPLLHALIDQVEDIWIRQGVHHVLRELRDTEISDAITDVYTALNSMDQDVEIIAAAERALTRLKPTAG